MREVIGLLVTPQNTAPMPTAAHSGIGTSESGGKKSSECGADERVGTISPPLYPAPRVAAVKTLFNMESQWKDSFSFHTSGDDIHAGSIICLIPHQHGQTNYNETTCQCTYIRIFKKAFVQAFRIVKCRAEQDADQGTQYSKNPDDQGVFAVKAGMDAIGKISGVIPQADAMP